MQTRISSVIRRKSPWIVEIAGPAGAGKTTLARSLAQHDENIRVADDLAVRKIDQIPTFVGNAPFLLPVFLGHFKHSRQLTWDETKALVYLKGWARVLRRQAKRRGKALLLDHGPVFKLATLHAFGPQRLKSKHFDNWWANMFKQWASNLDMVIWLDASDSDLVQRINQRDRKHAVKGKSDGEAYEYLARYRAAFRQILAELTACGGPTLLQFDTGRASTEQITEELLIAWD